MTSVRRAAPAAATSSARQLDTIKGRVRIQLVAKGSKSEHRSLVISYKGRTVQLQRVGGNPFEIDAKERALVGKTVTLGGAFVSDHIFRFSSSSVAKR